MSLKAKIVSSLVSVTIAAAALAGAVQPSSAKKLTPVEAAVIAGFGGLVIGSVITNAARAPYPEYQPVGSWDGHVQRCYARYRSYDHRTDTYIGYDGRAHYCTL